jgi:hypothetical protein
MASTDITSDGSGATVTLREAKRAFYGLESLLIHDERKSFEMNWEEDCPDWDKIKDTPNVFWDDPDTIPTSILVKYAPRGSYVDLRVLREYFDFNFDDN